MTTVLTPRAEQRVERLHEIWEERPGLLGWLTTVDHKRIGLLYLFTTMAFFLAGGVEALLMRTQLARPDQHVVSPETFNELFTTHGITMIFFAVIPMQIGAFGNYLVPLMIGARAGFAVLPSHLRNTGPGSAITVATMCACWRPQNSAHSPS